MTNVVKCRNLILTEIKGKIMNIIEQLNSGEIHRQARQLHPDRVCSKGNIHHSKERAEFVDWVNKQSVVHGIDVNKWSKDMKKELQAY